MTIEVVKASVKPSAEAVLEQSPVHSNAHLPPSSIPCVEPVVQNNAENGEERSLPNLFNAMQLTSTPSPKHDQSDIDDDASSSPQDFDSGDPLPSQCKYCPLTKIRLQILKSKIERHVRLKKKMSQKIAQLDKKNAIIAAVLGHFFTPDILPNSRLRAVLAQLPRNVEMPRPDSS